MRITEVAVYQVDLPLKEGRYAWSGGKSVSVFDATVVGVRTDSGLTGWGEVCPLGPVYLPAYAAGVRTGVAEVAPAILGRDPTQLIPLNQAMDRALKGHPYVKSAIDMACWDLLGKSSGTPVCTLLGGCDGEQGRRLYRAISQDTAAAMARRVGEYRAAGYRRFQLKVGGEPAEDVERIHTVRALLEPGDVLVADANTGWLTDAALRVVRGVRDLDVYVEQPCASYEECLTVRRATDHPFVLDETMDSIGQVARGWHDRAMDAINVKISKFGGLTRAREVRDLCVQLGIPMTIEDSWGGDIITAAIAHLANSTPDEFVFSCTDFNDYVTVSTAEGAPGRDAGRLQVTDRPGLGVEPRMDVLGEPAFVVR
jgi:L-alanine-DL-glutamate epimerase-like enolase superfamily enzyme